MYGITEVARRTGFTAPTLRYYERIGLLPPADRTGSGYRTYDDRTLERLTFVARAKQLGCTLEEITALLAAFDDDCAEVQAQLSALVDRKIADAQHQIADLVEFTAQLQRTAAALSSSATHGGQPCGDACGCAPTAPDGAGAGAGVPVTIGVTRDPDVVCTLEGVDDVRARIDEWRAVLAFATARSPIDGGVRVELDPAVPLDEVARLARAEQGCCAFFSFALTVDGRGVALEVRAPEAGQPIVTSIFGQATAPPAA